VDTCKNLFYCYGCGRGGDVIRFAELYHQVRFPQALGLLCQWRGMAPLLDETTLSIVAGTYPAPSHIVMTSRSAASDASARTSRIILVYTSPRGRMDVQYEELKVEIRRGGGASSTANLPSLTGNLSLAGMRAPTFRTATETYCTTRDKCTYEFNS